MENKYVTVWFSDPKYSLAEYDPSPTVNLKLTKALLDEFVEDMDIRVSEKTGRYLWHSQFYEDMRAFVLERAVDTHIRDIIKD